MMLDMNFAKPEQCMKPAVAILKLHGRISTETESYGGGKKHINFAKMRDMIDAAFAVENLKAVILNINSPGGSSVQSDLISSYIKQKAEEVKIPVVSIVEEMAASGGYWLACTGSEIYAARTSIVGSIGVITQGLGFHDLIQKWGIDNRTYTAGENKCINNPFDPVKESDVKITKSLLNEIHQVFINHVRDNRGDRLASDDETLFNGQYWIAETGLKLGLVDGIDNIDSYIAKKWGKDVLIHRIRKENKTMLSDLLDSIGPMISASRNPLSSVLAITEQLNAMNMSMDVANPTCQALKVQI